MAEMKLPILADEPPAPRIKPGDWMAANDSIRDLLPAALRRKAVEDHPPVPVRFNLTDDQQDQKPA